VNLSHIITEVCARPWAITPDAHAAIVSLIERKLNGTLAAAEATKERSNAPVMRMVGDVAVIPVEGTIIPRASYFERVCGAVGCNDISAMLDEAEDEGAAKVLFNFNSPGGSVQGVPELAARIASMKARTVAFSGGTMASAAYWLACGTDEIAVTQTCYTGSIGVFNASLDSSRLYESSGLKVNLFRSGDLKGAGFPGTALTDEERGHMQATVDELFAMFKGHVQAMRKPSIEVFRGGIVLGSSAVSLGLADRLVRSHDDAFALLGGNGFAAETSEPAWKAQGFSSPETHAAYMRNQGSATIYTATPGSVATGRYVDGKLVIE
jgi:signal peptide peptidase SppA